MQSLLRISPTTFNLKARVELKARRAELNGGLFGINTLLKAHNSHRQEQRCRKMLASQ